MHDFGLNLYLQVGNMLFSVPISVPVSQVYERAFS
jgi:hypothetical protein